MRVLLKYTAGLIFLAIGITISVVAVLIEAIYNFIVKNEIIIFD